MAGWRDLEARVDKAMTRAWSESVRISFLKNAVADPARPGPIDVTAILHTGGNDSYAAGNGLRVRLSGGQAELVIDRSTYAAEGVDWGYPPGSPPMPKTGDKVRANDRAGMPWFEVAAVSDRYSNLLVLSLGAA